MSKDKKGEKYETKDKEESKPRQKTLFEVERELEEEIKRAYINYAMSVIVARALPSVEDGLKPVQRRILYAMWLSGLTSNKPTRKCARIVGDVLGKFHPHGDQAVYDALVRMAQSFTLRYPLIEGQGNFGSIDGDPQAAMRYTEARLSKIAEEMLQDIDKQTVPFVANFDNTLKEPVLLPAKLPCLLVNGTSGIAVGMATSIPPHNLSKVIDAIVAYLKKPNITIDELAEIIEGPDFPTGALVEETGIKEMYKTGKAALVLRAKIQVEEKKNKKLLVITEIPYQVNKAELVKRIAELSKDKLKEINAVRDESARNKIRIVLETRKDANLDLIKYKLFKFTDCETKFYANWIALVKGEPKTLNLAELIKYWVEHRVEVIRNRSKFELTQAEKRLNVVEGLLQALSKIDLVIKLIKNARTIDDARKALEARLKLNREQANAILEMKLQRLTSMQRKSLEQEQKDLKIKIKKLKELLSSREAIINLIKQDLLELKKRYADLKRTKIVKPAKQVEEHELIKKEQVMVVLTARDYIKRISLAEYKEQRRGGKGTLLIKGDKVKHVFACSTLDYLLFLTERGKCFLLRAYKIPEARRYAAGRSIVNLLKVKESIKAVIKLETDSKYLVILTRKGMIKRISLNELKQVRKSGVQLIKLPTDDAVVDARIAGEDELIIATKKGLAIRFSVKELREMKRASYGVRGIKLDKDDEAVSLNVVGPADKQKSLLTVTERGYAKRSNLSEYRKTARGGKGIINVVCSARNGKVVKTEVVSGKDSILVSTAKGMLIRVKINEIREMKRATRGVKIINLKPDDKVVSVDLIEIEEANEVKE